MAPITEKSPKPGKTGSWLALAGLCAVVVMGAKELVRRRMKPPLNLRGKVVLISGGSRGLGFAMANELGRQGARLALCARDLDELQDACGRLAEAGIEAIPFVADLTRQASIQPLVTEALSRFGRIDVLINNAGSISVGPLRSFTHADFEQAMDLMFWGPLNLTFAVLPHMKETGEGHIVNVTSVGGRVSIPHLLPYSCAKFALVGFSTGLSTEAGAHGIRVLTVVPGLMRTGSYLNAEFKGASEDEFAWFGLLGNLPGFSVAADYAAQRIREAIENQDRVCTISLPAKILIACEALAPESTRTVLELVNRYLLPESSRRHAESGKALNPVLNAVFQGLTALGRNAARDLNE